jgi:hypothetical protein
MGGGSAAAVLESITSKGNPPPDPAGAYCPEFTDKPLAAHPFWEGCALGSALHETAGCIGSRDPRGHVISPADEIGVLN